MKPDDDIRQEVGRWPGATVKFEMGGKHRRAIITFSRKDRFVIFPTSPSDGRRGSRNTLSDVRRALKSLGAIRSAIPVGRGLRRRRNPGVELRPQIIGEPAPVMPDPWEPLRIAVMVQPEPVKPFVDRCECLSCASDMKGIYPCLLEDEQ